MSPAIGFLLSLLLGSMQESFDVAGTSEARVFAASMTSPNPSFDRQGGIISIQVVAFDTDTIVSLFVFIMSKNTMLKKTIRFVPSGYSYTIHSVKQIVVTFTKIVPIRRISKCAILIKTIRFYSFVHNFMKIVPVRRISNLIGEFPHLIEEFHVR